MLDKAQKRACLLIIKMFYKNEEYKFMIPWRSNIPSALGKQKNIVYKMPPTYKTKKGHIACLDFRKAIIVPKHFSNAYNKFVLTENSDKNSTHFIEKHLKEIVQSFKCYLQKYEKNKEDIKFCVDIDRIIRIVNKKGID